MIEPLIALWCLISHQHYVSKLSFKWFGNILVWPLADDGDCNGVLCSLRVPIRYLAFYSKLEYNYVVMASGVSCVMK